MVPSHCDRPMRPDFTIGSRTNWICACTCGHRAWSGPEASLKRPAPPSTTAGRPCHLCHLPLPKRTYAQTKYHAHCRLTVKRLAGKRYARRATALAKASAKRAQS